MPAPVPDVLVIDDDELSRELLIVFLESEGHSASGFESGEEALEALHAAGDTKPAAIVSDFQMPGLSGNPLAEALRTAAPSATLLAISATQPFPEEISSFDGFLLKPFDATQLTVALAAPPKPATTQSTSEPASDPNTPQVLDQTVYKNLAAQMPRAQLRQLYEFSLADANRRVVLLLAAIEAADGPTFVREAHSLQGGCGLIGALELRAVAKEMEAKGLPAASLLPEISACIGRLQRMLETLADM